MPSEKGTLPLYLGKCTEDLEFKFERLKMAKQIPKMVCNTLDTLLKKGDERMLKGDEEMAYIHFRRCIDCVRWIQEAPNYEEIKYLLRQSISELRVKEILNFLEKMAKRLKDRYEAKKLKDQHDAKKLDDRTFDSSYQVEMSSERGTIPLYLGKCIEDLEFKFERLKMAKLIPKMVCNTLDVLLENGDERMLKGDEEMVYIHFRRCIDCVRWIQEAPNYEEIKYLLRQSIPLLRVKEILNFLEKMAKRLKDRYEAKKLKDQHEAKKLEDRWKRNKLKYRRLRNSSEGIENTVENMENESEQTEPETIITCREMFQEMEQLLDRMIIFDIRDKDDFQKSHVRSDQCINIPAEFIRPGKSTIDIFKSLRPAGKTLKILNHRAREHCDLIVLLDWQTTKASLKPANRLHVLKTIMGDREQDVGVYNEILVLDGGYKEWLNCFPNITTDPKVTVPDVGGNRIAEIFEEVEYPEPTQLDKDLPIIMVKSKPIPEISLESELSKEKDLILDKFENFDTGKSNEPKSLYNSNKVNTHAITCVEMFREMRKLRDRIMIIDIRDECDFQKSHVKSDQCINIPAVYIRPGKLATDIFECLRPMGNGVRVICHRAREHCDLVVLLDWQTTEASLKPANQLYVLETIMWDRDPGVAYNKILVLEGGYKEWLTCFPSMCTNRRVTVPDVVDITKQIFNDWNIELDEDQPMINVTSKLFPVKSTKPKIKNKIGVIGAQTNITDHALIDGTKSALANKAGNNSNAESEKMMSLSRQEKEVLKSQARLRKKKLLLESQLSDREDNEDYNFEEKDRSVKRIDVLSPIMTKKAGENTEIECMQQEHRQKNIDVEPSHEKKKTQLDLDIGIAESDVRPLASQRKVFSLRRDKKLDENLEMKQKNMSTPPRETTPDTHRTPSIYDGPSPDSSLKRSYSSPNLMQVKKLKLQDEVSGSRGLDNNMPRMDRTSTPLQQLYSFTNKQPVRVDWDQRMDPVYGDVHPGITGLKNLGNSCYMNSIIQCLSNTTRLARYFIQGSYTKDLYRKNKKTDTLVVEEVAQVIKALWCGRYRSISPRDLKVVIGRYRSEFENYQQQDSHEFLTFLLNWMHNDLKTTAQLEIDRSISNAEKHWDRAMRGETSIIWELFFSQLRSTIRCETCRNSSTTYEIFNSLTLSVSDSHRCTLDDCVRQYLSEQQVSGRICSNCDARRDAKKKIDFIKLAPIIVVHLSRFGASDGWVQKNNTAVNFPLDSLDLRSHVVHQAGTNTTTTNQQKYTLYAVLNHYGTMESGHYTAYCKHASQNKWYKYDDRTVTEVPPKEVKSETASAYLFFYTSVQTFPYMVM